MGQADRRDAWVIGSGTSTTFHVRSGDASDVKVRASSMVFEVHRSVLCGRSRVLAVMLEGGDFKVRARKSTVSGAIRTSNLEGCRWTYRYGGILCRRITNASVDVLGKLRYWDSSHPSK